MGCFTIALNFQWSSLNGPRRITGIVQGFPLLNVQTMAHAYLLFRHSYVQAISHRGLTLWRISGFSACCLIIIAYRSPIMGWLFSCGRNGRNVEQEEDRLGEEERKRKKRRGGKGWIFFFNSLIGASMTVSPPPLSYSSTMLPAFVCALGEQAHDAWVFLCMSERVSDRGRVGGHRSQLQRVVSYRIVLHCILL